MTTRKHEQFKWNETNVATLQELWDTHVRAKEIAQRLGTTKNAVIGKANRMGLKPRRDPNLVRDKPPPSVARAIVPVAKRKRITRTADKTERGIINRTAYGELSSLKDLGKSQCIWPIGEVGKAGFGFCAADSGKGNYCDEHVSIAFQGGRR